MSSATWTPDALSSEIAAYAGTVWRLVEAQHQVSTLKLTGNLAEQEMLERLIEATKPPVPPECGHLDYLLATPFRYGTYPNGSRFRRAGRTPGVFYAAEHTATAVAEMAFCRLLFFAESPATPLPDRPLEFTAVAAAIATERAIDLTLPPLVADRETWVHPTEYGRCQDLAEAARSAGAVAIRYQSVRDPARRANLAVLACAAFADPAPVGRQTWRMRIGRTGVQALCDFPRTRLGFEPADFITDPRIAAAGLAG